MGRPTIIEDAALLEAAREVFLRKGLSATTAEVALSAGISQASIFKRYKTKQELFWAAMRAGRERLDMVEAFKKRAGVVGLREALIEMGVDLIAFGSQVMPLAMVAWSSREAFGAEAAPAQGSPFQNVSLLEELVAFFEAEMEAGRLRRQDGWIVLRLLLGAVNHYVWMTTVWKVQPGPPLTPEPYMRAAVGVLWEGIGPKGRSADTERGQP